MTPPRTRKGTAGPAQAPLIQPRPAEQFPPNPVAGRRAGPERPVDRVYRVTGPKAVGGVLAPGTVVLCITDAQAAALEAGGHVEAVRDKPMAGTE